MRLAAPRSELPQQSCASLTWKILLQFFRSCDSLSLSYLLYLLHNRPCLLFSFFLILTKLLY